MLLYALMLMLEDNYVFMTAEFFNKFGSLFFAYQLSRSGLLFVSGYSGVVHKIYDPNSSPPGTHWHDNITTGTIHGVQCSINNYYFVLVT